jgi:hypothetical protein
MLMAQRASDRPAESLCEICEISDICVRFGKTRSSLVIAGKIEIPRLAFGSLGMTIPRSE